MSFQMSDQDLGADENAATAAPNSGAIMMSDQDLQEPIPEPAATNGFSYKIPGLDRVNPYQDVVQPAEALGAGLLQGGQELGAGAAKYIVPGLSLGHLQAVAAPDYSQLASVRANPGTFLAGDVAGGIASSGPLYDASGISQIPSALGRVGANTAFGAGLATVTNPNPTVGTALVGGALGGVPSGAVEGVNAGLNKLIGEVPASQGDFNQALDTLGMTDDVPTPYKTGDVNGQKLFENTLINMPGSGALPIAQNIVDKFDQNVQDLRNGFDSEGKTSNELQQYAVKKINDQFDINNAEHKQNYQNISDYANAGGIKVQLPSYTQSLQSIVNSAQDPASQALLQEPPSQVVSTAQKALDGLGRVPDGQFDFNTATKADAQLNSKIQDAYGSGDYQTANFYKAQQGALRQDIEDSVKQSGDPNLMGMWQDAKQNFAQKVAPFFDDNLPFSKYIGQKPNSPIADNVLKDFVSTGKYGNPQELKTSLNLVPGLQDPLGYLHLNNASNLNRNVNKDDVANVLQQYGSLNQDTVNALYTPQQNNQLNALNLAYRGLGSLRSNVQNLNTGGKNTWWDIVKSMAHSPLAAGAAGAAGFHNFSPEGLAVAGLVYPTVAGASLGGKIGLSRLATNALMSNPGSALLPQSLIAPTMLGGVSTMNALGNQ